MPPEPAYALWPVPLAPIEDEGGRPGTWDFEAARRTADACPSWAPGVPGKHSLYHGRVVPPWGRHGKWCSCPVATNAQGQPYGAGREHLAPHWGPCSGCGAKSCEPAYCCECGRPFTPALASAEPPRGATLG